MKGVIGGAIAPWRPRFPPHRRSRKCASIWRAEGGARLRRHDRDSPQRAWIYHGGGPLLSREMLAKHGVYNIPCAIIPPQASGWRFFGPGAKTMAKLGVSRQLLAPAGGHGRPAAGAGAKPSLFAFVFRALGGDEVVTGALKALGDRVPRLVHHLRAGEPADLLPHPPYGFTLFYIKGTVPPSITYRASSRSWSSPRPSSRSGCRARSGS